MGGDAAASEYCSLVLRVSDGHGNRPDGITAKVVEQNGRVEIRTTERGEARFCDLGLSGVTVTVGNSDHCDEVVVRNVPILWGVERTVNVIYSRDGCNADEVRSAGCGFLLRFLDSAGRPVPDVRLDPPDGEQPDAQARVLVWMRTGQTLSETARSQGYLPERVELKCDSSPRRQEKLVTLRQAK